MCCNEVADISFAYAFSLLLDILANLLRQELFLSEKQTLALMDRLISEIPSVIKQRLQVYSAKFA